VRKSTRLDFFTAVSDLDRVFDAGGSQVLHDRLGVKRVGQGWMGLGRGTREKLGDQGYFIGLRKTSATQTRPFTVTAPMPTWV